MNVHRCSDCVHPHLNQIIEGNLFLTGAPQDQWWSIFFFCRPHDVHLRSFESLAFEMTRNHCAVLSIQLPKAEGDHTTECACGI